MILARSFETFCRLFYRVYCPLIIVGRDNLPRTPFMLCSNHSSHMDSAVLMTASGLPFDRFGMVAAKDYFFDDARRKKLLSSMMNLIPIDRKSGRDSILRNLETCREFAVEGKRNLIIYPEGTRSKTKQMAEFKKGAALIAVELGLPVVPAYIEGAYESMPKGVSIPKARPVRVLFGKAIDTNEWMVEKKREPLRNNEIYQQVTTELEKRVRELGSSHDVIRETHEVVGLGS